MIGRRIVVAVFATALFAFSVRAERRRAVVTPDLNAIAIEFVDVASLGGSMTSAQSDAWLDVGTISKLNQRERGIHVRRDIGIRLVRTGPMQFGTARLSARLQSIDGRTEVFLDGRRLSTVPTIIDSHVSVGPVSTHHLDISVPEFSPAGPLSTAVVWEVVSEP